ncbi:MAG: alpha/beta hydrolase [Mycobacterium sp.]|jgi:hypothetical protein|nr:alpha/beta hydrolase [Mycobacterium sp.]
MAGDLAALLEHFDVHDAVLVGHPMGGFIAIRALLDHPELALRLRGLVLFATWAGRILDGASMFGTRPSPAMISVGRDMFLQRDHGPLLPILRAFAREDRYPRLAEITVPTVVIVGSADRTTSPNHPRARRWGARCSAGYRARRRAHAELGGARRARRRRRIVSEAVWVSAKPQLVNCKASRQHRQLMGCIELLAHCGGAGQHQAVLAQPRPVHRGGYAQLLPSCGLWLGSWAAGP